MRTCDAKQAPCSSMNLIRGLSLSLRTAIGLHAGSAPVQLTATSRQLGVLQHRTPLPAAATACAAAQRLRVNSTTAAAASSTSSRENDVQQDAAAAQSTAEPIADGTPVSASAAAAAPDSAAITEDVTSSSGRDEGHDSRAVYEPVAAEGVVAEGSLPNSSSSSSNGSISSNGRSHMTPVGPRRPGHPFGPRGTVRRAPPPPSAAAVGGIAQSQRTLPSNTAASNGASSSSGWGDWDRDMGNSSSSSSWGRSAARHTNGLTAGSSGSTSRGLGEWRRKKFMWNRMSYNHLELIKSKGLTALPNWGVWGTHELLQAWEAASAALPAALERLAAVGRDADGPVKVVFFDFETTGLIGKVHPCEPVELGAAASDGQTFQSLISPLGVIPRNDDSPDGLMVHKLTWADLQHEPPTAVVFLRWVEWLTQLCTSTERGSCRLVLAGHNVGFDLGVLKLWLKPLGVSEEQQHVYWGSLCTLYDLGKGYKAAQDKTPGGPTGAGLEALGKHFNFPRESDPHLQSHRALGDVLENQYVFRKLAEWKLGVAADALSLDELAERLTNIIKPPAAATGRSAAAAKSKTAAAKAQPAAAPAAKGLPATAAKSTSASKGSQASVQQPTHTAVQQPAPPTAALQLQQQQQDQAQQLQQQPVGVSQQQQQQQPQHLQQEPVVVSQKQQQPPSKVQQPPAPAVLQPPPPPSQPPLQQLPGTSFTGREPQQQLGQQQQRQQQQQQADSNVTSREKAREEDFALFTDLLKAAEAAQNEGDRRLFKKAARRLAKQNGFDIVDEQHYRESSNKTTYYLEGWNAPLLLPAEDQAASKSSSRLFGSLDDEATLNTAGPDLAIRSPVASQHHSSSSSSSEDSSSNTLLQHAVLEDQNTSSSGSRSSSIDGSNTKAARGDGPSSRRSSGSSIGSYVLPSSSSWLEELPSTDVEAAVKRGLESLASQNLHCWDQRQLSQAWPLLGQPLNPKDQLVSKRMYEKLIGAKAFDNYLKVLSYTPTIVQYHSSIPLESSSSSSSEADDSLEDSIDAGDAADGVKHHVQLKARCLATTTPRIAANGVIWSALLEAPADSPSAGPVGLSVSFFIPGSGGYVLGNAHRDHQQALDAIKSGTSVLLRGRVKPLGKDKKIPYFKPRPDLAPTWEACGTPMVTWSESAAATDADTGATTDADASKGTDSSSNGGEVLEAQYKKLKDLRTLDWLGNGGDRLGIIPPLLEAVREQGALQDVLPEEVQQKYGLGNWLEDLEEVHRPTTEAKYQRACKGVAMRELVLMQVAQFLERYRLTSDFAIQSLAGELLPQLPAHTDAGAPAQPQRRASMRPRKTPAAGSRGAGSKSAGSNGSSPHSSSDSEEDLSLTQLRKQLQGPLDAFDLMPQQHRVRSSAQQTSAAQRGSAAYSVHYHEVIDTAKDKLGWDLTADQERVLEEVMADMKGPRAMLRLLQGDVGCGKTIIALLACLAAAAQGYQALLFAPTELLAGQHNKTLERLAEDLPITGMRPRVGMLVGSITPAAKKQLKKEIAAGDKNIIISTQAALWVKDWHKLALVVVDEQHKLGVKQREKLTRGQSAPPHMLLMTATPIPRTMAIMLYGGLALSTIRELPPGRTPVVTHVVPDEDSGRQQVYEVIKEEINSGGRAYIVCPLVNESDAYEDVRTVQDEFARLSSSGIFGDSSKCGMLHGKMDAEEKALTLERFKSGETPVLIASTVVEVGVDVPDASVMLVEAAHRFGLAQLHQLRGRVGRGSKASRCFLMAPAEDPKGTERLQVLEQSSDGLAIAQADLDIRGPGDLWSGTKQSGKKSQLSKITMRQLEADDRIVEHARYIAAQLLLSISSNTAVKAALLASGIMELKEGETLPVARFGISGM